MSVTNAHGTGHDLDDLGSFDGSDPTEKYTHSPQARMYNHLDIPLPDSPTRSLLSSDGASYGRKESHSVNAVHMHVQENAKVPLYTHPVDRKNSSRPSYPDTSDLHFGTHEAEEFSMAELFLSKESKSRQSRNMAYEGIGSLLEDIGFTAGRRHPQGDGSGDGSNSKTGEASSQHDKKEDTTASSNVEEDHTQMEIDALTAAVDPTPWSEIEQKIQNIHQKRATQQSAQVLGAVPALHYNYYPYERRFPLPITEQAPAAMPPAGQQNTSSQSLSANVALETPAIAQAIATAAAIASVGGTTAQPPTQTATLPSVVPPYTQAQQTEAGTNTKMPDRNIKRQPASHPPAPQHAMAHTKNRASVLAAAQKKSQYGFGGDHTVPSVPAPPPTVTTGSNNKKSPTAKTNPKSAPQSPQLPDLQNASETSNNVAAYERKKQRAKLARVKTNESIERLSIAMSLAGSQSKQRSNLLNNRISKTEQRAKTLQINDECSKLVEQAKKWDRPSFVGTAASLIQAMNSQCESLARELVCFQERLDAMTGIPGNVPHLAKMNGNGMTSHPDSKRHEHPSDDSDGSPAKRMRGEKEEEVVVGDNEDDQPTEHGDVSADKKLIFSAVACMLDPVSLSRCACVSSSWRDMNAFDADKIWLDLAVKRFGFFNVRQWIEKLEDDEDGEGIVTRKALYRAMNSANIMPPIQQKGLSLLGDARIPGRLSAWVFLVERSNGETLRSVKREPESTAPSSGPYQSRPVVELRIVIQNNGMANHPIIIKNQPISVDVSTRRKGGELTEISWDDRFQKVVKNLDGSKYKGGGGQSRYDVQGELCRLALFEAAVIEVHINAKGCSTTAKFQQRSNFTKILVFLEGTTVPLVVPFLRDGNHVH